MTPRRVLLLLALAGLAAPMSLSAASAVAQERIWILTDQTALTSALVGIEVGPAGGVFTLVRSKSPRVFRGLDLLSGGRVATIEAGGLAGANKLQAYDGSTGDLLASHGLPNIGLAAVEAFPDGTFGVAQGLTGTGSVYHVDAQGHLLTWWTLDYELNDLHVDAQGHVWITEDAIQHTWHFDADGNQLDLLNVAGRQVTTAPDGTLWFLPGRQRDLLHTTRDGTQLGTIGLPTLQDPAALAVDSLDTVWVSGHGADRIERYTPEGTHLQTVALPGPVGVQQIVAR